MVGKLEESLEQALAQLATSDQRARKMESEQARYEIVERQSELMGKVV